MNASVQFPDLRLGNCLQECVSRFFPWVRAKHRVRALVEGIRVGNAIIYRPTLAEQGGRPAGRPNDLHPVELRKLDDHAFIPTLDFHGLLILALRSRLHLRRNNCAWHRSDRWCLVGTDVWLWLLDWGLGQIWWNIGRQVRRECGVWKVRYRGSRHASLLFSGATATERCLFQRAGGES